MNKICSSVGNKRGLVQISLEYYWTKEEATFDETTFSTFSTTTSRVEALRGDAIGLFERGESVYS